MNNHSFLQQIQSGKGITIKISAEAAEKLMEILCESHTGLYWVYYAGDKTPHLTADAGLDYDLLCDAECCEAWVDIDHFFNDALDSICPHCGDTLSFGREMDTLQYEMAIEDLDRKRKKVEARMDE